MQWHYEYHNVQWHISQESDGGHHSSIHAKRMSPKSRRQSAVSKLSSLLISSPLFSYIVHVPHSQESCVRYRDRRIGCTNDATYKLLFLPLNNPGVSLVLMPRSFAAISRPQESRLAFLMALPLTPTPTPSQTVSRIAFQDPAETPRILTTLPVALVRTRPDEGEY